MRILLIAESKHMGNTLKIARAMAQEAPEAVVTDTAHAREHTFRDFDIIGFGSGIYYGKPDKRIIELLEGVCDKKAYGFVFSTSGTGKDEYTKPMADILKRKNKVVLGSFSCKGFDKYFIFKLFGGINKGHPDESDLENAKRFMRGVIEKYRKAEGK